MSNYKGIVSELMEFHPEFFSGETIEGVSETVPNQALSAKEVVERALHNLPSPCVANSPDDLEFDGTEEDLRDLDSVRSPRFENEMDVMDFHSTLLDQARAARAQAAPQEPAQPAPAAIKQNNPPEPAPEE